MQIVILGAHRSGTSVVTRLVNLMGAYIGAEGTSIGFNDENPKGFWERKDVTELNDAILHNADCTWDDLYKWDGTNPTGHDAAIKNIALELDAHRPWVTKDPRLCQTFGLWREHLEVPLVIVCWRDPMEVAMSLHKRNGFSLLHGLAIWEHCTLHALKQSEGLARLIISHHDILAAPVKQCQILFEWLQSHHVSGLHLPSEEEITHFIDPSLHRAKTRGEPSDIIAPAILDWLEYLLTPDAALPHAQLSAVSREALATYHQTRIEHDEKERIRLRSIQQDERIAELDEKLMRFQAEEKWQLEEGMWLQHKKDFDRLAEKLDMVNEKIDDVAQQWNKELSDYKQSRLFARLRRFAGFS